MNINQFQVLILKAPSEELGAEHAFINVLSSKEIPAVMIPTLQFQFKNLERLQNCLNNPENYSGLLINSPRCAESIMKGFSNKTDSKLKEEWKKLKCFVVGDSTARIASGNLQLSCEGNTCGNLASLLQMITLFNIEKPLLMPCGNLHKATSFEKDVKIEKVIVYETTEHPELKSRLQKLLTNNPNLSIIVFFSPSGVRYAVPHISEICQTQIQYIAIGPTTAKELEIHNCTVSAVCEKPNPESLVQSLLEIVKND